MFRLGNSVPTYHMHLFLNNSITPNKISLRSINELMNFTREANELHDLVENTTKTGLCKGSSTRHIKEFRFSPSSLLFILSKMNLK